MRYIFFLTIVLIQTSCLKKEILNLNGKKSIQGEWNTSHYLDLDYKEIEFDSDKTPVFRNFKFTSDSINLTGKSTNSPFMINPDSFQYQYTGTWDILNAKKLELNLNHFERTNEKGYPIYFIETDDSIITRTEIDNDELAIVLSSEFSPQITFEIHKWKKDEIWLQIVHDLNELGHIEVIRKVKD